MNAKINPKAFVLALSALILLVFLAILFETRAFSELKQARTAVAAGNFEAADRHYFQAINWYAPWGSSQTAAEELYQMGLAHLREGRKQESFHSFLRLRSALIAARSFYLPRPDLIEAINPFLALFLAENKLGPKADHQAITSEAAVYLNLYDQDPSSNQRWYFLAVLGFLLWIGAGFRLIFIYFKNPNICTPPLGLRSMNVWAFVFIYGYAMWIFAMKMA
ncbi:MAG: hypothetical protein LBT47_03765 [Deltaproteobacteria bacterium]|jgi:tetratricopeptide (TPR) repeat protein|nr:hypothetical protein [Deltaproteobacteria bacterium]